MTKQFQYRRMHYNAIGYETLIDNMNAQGSEGWEAIFFERTQQGLSIIYKKEIQGTYTIPVEEQPDKQYIVVLSPVIGMEAAQYFNGWQTATSIVTTDDPDIPKPMSLGQAILTIERLSAIGITAFEVEVF